MDSMSIRISMAQFAASNQVSKNLDQMKKYLEQAEAQKSQVMVFPEMAYFLGSKDESIKITQDYDKLCETFSRWAREHQLFLIPGTLREPDQNGSDRCYNTLPVFDPSGKQIASYRKIFLFKADLPDRSYDEEKTFLPGAEPTTVDFPWGKTGLSICYDLRFPELFRLQRNRGCRFQILPAAFTVPTGKAHWDALTRARAIENQCFFLAPGLVGKCGDGRVTYGHSRVISPWGEIIAELKDAPGFVSAEISPEALDIAQDQVNCWKSRRTDLFPA